MVTLAVLGADLHGLEASVHQHVGRYHTDDVILRCEKDGYGPAVSAHGASS